MRRNRFTEDQIIGVLRKHEAGVKAAELCRKHGISDATFYNWKAKYGGMTVSEAARLRTLEDENRRPKKLLAEPMLSASGCLRSPTSIVGSAIAAARRIIEAWRMDYHTMRPHSSLGGMASAELRTAPVEGVETPKLTWQRPENGGQVRHSGFPIRPNADP